MVVIKQGMENVLKNVNNRFKLLRIINFNIQVSIYWVLTIIRIKKKKYQTIFWKRYRQKLNLIDKQKRK